MRRIKRVGVVVGRFQVAALHDGHTALLNHVKAKEGAVLVALGVPAVCGTRRDPLDYETRRLLIQTHDPEIHVAPIWDNPSDELWSAALDKIVAGNFPGAKATLYGGRDSCFPHYKGKMRKRRFRSGLEKVSATAHRARIAASHLVGSYEFCKGAIYTCERSIPRLYMCVDVAVLDKVNDKVSILLGRKHAKDLWCLPGGFVDPTDESLAEAAARELSEETTHSVDVGGAEGMEYVGSTLVDDWRYKGPDRIMTALFVCRRVFGPTGYAKAGDDLAEVKWFPLPEDKRGRKGLMLQVKPHHRPLLDMVVGHIDKNQRCLEAFAEAIRETV